MFERFKVNFITCTGRHAWGATVCFIWRLELDIADYEEKENLSRALVGIREVLAHIDSQIDEHEKHQKLIEIYNKVDGKSSAMFNKKMFKVRVTRAGCMIVKKFVWWLYTQSSPQEIHVLSQLLL